MKGIPELYQTMIQRDIYLWIFIDSGSRHLSNETNLELIRNQV